MVGLVAAFDRRSSLDGSGLWRSYLRLMDQDVPVAVKELVRQSLLEISQTCPDEHSAAAPAANGTVGNDGKDLAKYRSELISISHPKEGRAYPDKGRSYPDKERSELISISYTESPYTKSLPAVEETTTPNCLQ